MSSATPAEVRIRLRVGLFEPRAEITLDRQGITFPLARLQWHKSLASILEIPAPPSRRILWPHTRPLQMTRDHSGHLEYVFGEGDIQVRVLDSELHDPELFRRSVETFSGRRFEAKFPTNAPAAAPEVNASPAGPSRPLPSETEIFYVVPFSSGRLAIFLWSCLSLMSAIAILIALSLVFGGISRFLGTRAGNFVVEVVLAGAMLLPWLRHRRSRFYIAIADDGLYSALPSRFPRFTPWNQIQDFTVSEIERPTNFQLIGFARGEHPSAKRFTLYTSSGTYAVDALDIHHALSGKLASRLANPEG